MSLISGRWVVAGGVDFSGVTCLLRMNPRQISPQLRREIFKLKETVHSLLGTIGHHYLLVIVKGDRNEKLNIEGSLGRAFESPFFPFLFFFHSSIRSTQ